MTTIMQSITLNISISTEAAIRAKKCVAGESHYAVSEALLAQGVGTEIIAWKAQETARTVLRVTDLSAEAVAAALREWFQGRMQEARAVIDAGADALMRERTLSYDTGVTYRVRDLTTCDHAALLRDVKGTPLHEALRVTLEEADKRETASRKAADEEHQRRNIEVQEKRKAVQAEREAEAAQRDEGAARWADMRHTILERVLLPRAASPSQKERFQAGVLPEGEIIAMLEADLFRFDDADLYARMTPSDVHAHDECDDDEVRFTKVVVETWTAEAWEARKRVLEKVPSAKIELRKHEGTCNVCSGEQVRYSMLVRARDLTGEVRSIILAA